MRNLASTLLCSCAVLSLAVLTSPAQAGNYYGGGTVYYYGGPAVHYGAPVVGYDTCPALAYRPCRPPAYTYTYTQRRVYYAPPVYTYARPPAYYARPYPYAAGIGHGYGITISYRSRPAWHHATCRVVPLADGHGGWLPSRRAGCF
jgi:hypothetical protein